MVVMVVMEDTMIIAWSIIFEQKILGKKGLETFWKQFTEMDPKNRNYRKLRKTVI